MKNIIRLLLLFMLLFSVFNSFSNVASQSSTTDTEDETDTTTTDESETETETEEEDEEDEVSDEDIESAYEREVQIEADDEKIKIESQLKNGENKDKLTIEFEATSEEPEIEFRYKKESNSLESDLRYKIKFEQIIEYLDNGTVGNGYQAGEEVSFYRLDKVEWNAIVQSVETVGLDEINVFSVSTMDGVFTLVMKISSSIINLENTTFTPNSLKIDVEFRDFPYQGNNTSLALESKVKSVSKQEVKHETEEELSGLGNNETQVSIGTNGEGFFSWAEYALADGVNIDVLSSSLTDSTNEEDDLEVGENSGKLYFSFIVANASEIIWDPKVGVVSEGTTALLNVASAALTSGFSSAITTATTTSAVDESDDSSAPFFSVWMAFVMISGIVIIRRKFT